MRFITSGCLWGAVVALSLFGCEKKQPTTSVAPAASSASDPAVDPAIAKAMAAASASSGANPAQAGGPPESGVFAPGQADRELPAGAAPKLTLGSTGAEPRTTLADMQPDPGKYPLRVKLQTRSEGGALPLDFELQVSVTAPKAAKPGDAPAPADALLVSAKVTSAKLDTTLLGGGSNKEAEAIIAKLKGSEIAFTAAPNGAGAGFKVTTSKGSDPGLEGVLRSLGDVLAFLALPYPAESVGAGAFWGATTRETVLGVDSLAYRLINVQSIENGVVTLKVESKRYAANARQKMAGLVEGADELTLQRFEAIGSGSVKVAAGSFLPVQAELNQATGWVAETAPGQPPVAARERVTAEVTGSKPAAQAGN
jgi:hypothetical protein